MGCSPFNESSDSGKMFRTYGELIDKASAKGRIEIEEYAIRLFYDDKELPLPMLNIVVIPGEYIGDFTSKAFLDYSKLFKFIKFKEPSEIPEKLKNRQFYCWAIFHGRDYGHHGEPCSTGLLIESESLDKIRDQEVKKNSELYKLLKGLEDFKAPQSSERIPAFTNPKLPLEEKIFQIKPFNQT